jgi:hypothetical protein
MVYRVVPIWAASTAKLCAVYIETKKHWSYPVVVCCIMKTLALTCLRTLQKWVNILICYLLMGCITLS